MRRGLFPMSRTGVLIGILLAWICWAASVKVGHAAQLSSQRQAPASALSTVVAVVGGRGATLYAQPGGSALQPLSVGTRLTGNARTPDSTAIRVVTQEGLEGWVETGRLLVVSVSRLPIAGPGAESTLPPSAVQPTRLAPQAGPTAAASTDGMTPTESPAAADAGRAVTPTLTSAVTATVTAVAPMTVTQPLTVTTPVTDSAVLTSTDSLRTAEPMTETTPITVTSSATVTPTVTATVVTATVTVTATAAPTASRAIESSTSTPTAAAVATATPLPTATPTQTPTSTPTSTATLTPPPTATSTATSTPPPTFTPTPTATATPTPFVPPPGAKAVALVGEGGAVAWRLADGLAAGRFAAGVSVMASSRSTDDAWVFVFAGDGLHGWVASDTVQVLNRHALPAEALTLTPAALTVNQIGARLNVRAGPDPDQAIITRVLAGDSFIPLGRDETGAWIQILLSSASAETGWVSSQFVTVTVPVARLPVVE